MARRPQQLALEFRSWGGRRPGAGRKPAKARAGVSHGARPELDARFPVHVTLRLCDGLPTLRSGRAYAALRACFAAARRKAEGGGQGRVVHYAVLGNHVHLLVEAEDRVALSRLAQGLATRFARALNRLAGRRGDVFADRYHARILRTPREVRNALAYVLTNARRHGFGRGCGRSWLDPFSSAHAFDGWIGPVRPAAIEVPVSRARTWLLAVGWRRHGRIDPSGACASP